MAAQPAHDVAIVGGGAVGLLLACLLAQRGIDIVVLERRSAPAGRARAIGIHPPGLAALTAAGIGDAVRAEATAIRSGMVRFEGRTLGRLVFTGEPVRSLPQDRTEALLEARLAELAPGALHRGVEVAGLRTGDEAVALDLRHGGTAIARFAVGADGVRSTVRGLLGIGWEQRTGTGRYAMADAADATRRPHTAVLHLERGGVVESFPLPGGRRRWVARLASEAPGAAGAAGEAGTMDAEALAALIEDRTGTRLDRTGLAPSSVFSAAQHLATGFSRGRVALAGDAAHEVSPIGGQGMNLGWLDAVQLDSAIADALDGGAAGTSATAFGRYARRRRASAIRAMRQAAFNMAMGAPVSGVRVAARNAFVRALAVSPLRTRLAAAFTMQGL